MITSTIISISIILSAAILIGELFERLKIPSVAGNLLSGLILGPTFLDVISPSAALSGISSISLFFIILLIGLQMRMEHVRQDMDLGIRFAFSSFAVPAMLVFFASAFLLHFALDAAFIIALAVSVPSISIVSVFVSHQKLLKRKAGRVILSATVMSDIVAFIALAFVSRAVASAITVLIYTLILLAILALANMLLNYKPKRLKALFVRLSKNLKIGYASVAAFILFGLLIASIFESIGISYVIGAFFAGLLVHEELTGHRTHGRLERTFSRMNNAFFIPAFFGIAGVQATFQGWSAQLMLALPGIAILTFISSYALTHYLAGKNMSNGTDMRQKVAGILSGRGAVGVAIAIIALNLGIISGIAYSFIIVATVIISVLAALMLMRSAADNKHAKRAKGAGIRHHSGA